MHVLAVDGGASSTRALIGTVDGEVRAIGYGGPSNHLYGEGARRRLERALNEAVESALAQLDLPSRHFESCWLGMTGVSDESQDRSLVEACLRSLVSWERIGVSGDILPALVGASIHHPGVIVYAGTGSVAYGVDAGGHTAKIGGWGSLIDDEGGGYHIGRAALKAVFRAADGRAEATFLTEALLGHFGVSTLSDLRRTAYLNDGLERPQVAQLSELVSRAAAEGDRVAQNILSRAAEELAELAAAAVRQLPSLPNPATVYFSGGVFEAGAPLQIPFSLHLERLLRTVQVLPPAFPPLLGGYLLAVELCGADIDAPFLERLRRSFAAFEEQAPL